MIQYRHCRRCLPFAAGILLSLTGFFRPCRAELAEWRTLLDAEASATQLSFRLSRMVTAPEFTVFPAVTGDRTYEFITRITLANTSSNSVALASDGAFAYKLLQYGQPYYAPGCTRYGVADDVFTPLAYESTRIYLTTVHTHFVVQADGTGLLYVDGTLRGTMAAGLQPVLTGNVLLGASNLDGRDAMGNGAIIACAVYDKALSTSEVAARAQAWNVEYSGPAGIATEMRRDLPAHWWRMSEPFTTQPVADSGLGDPHPGTFAGGCTAGQAGPHSSAGTAVRFAGPEFADPGRITVQNLPQYRHYTMEAWLYLDADADSVYFPVVTHDNPEAYSGLSLFPSQARVSATVSVHGSVSADEYAPPRVSRGRWHHVALTNDGSLTVYLDGLQARSRVTGLDDDISHGSTNGQLTIGAVLGGFFPAGIKGMIDEVAVYSYALPAERIQQHYLAGGGVLPATQANPLGSNEPFNETAWQSVPAAVNFDVGRLASITVAPGSALPAAADSAPPSVLNDGDLGDDGLDSKSSPGPNGKPDGFFFSDSPEIPSGRILMTFNEPVVISYVRVWGGCDRVLYAPRTRIAGSVWMTAATGAVPSTAGEMESNAAWRRLGVMWTPVENQSMVELVAPHGSIGPVKYLVFEFDSAGDGQSNIIREIDVRGGPAFSQPDLRIEKVNGSTVRLNWRAEYENWYLEQQVNDPRYGWTPAFLGSNLPVVQNYRTSRDYNIPAAGMQPNTQKRSLFRMFRVDPVEAP